MDRMNGLKRCGSYSSLDQSSTLTAGPMVRDDKMQPYRFDGLVQGRLLQLQLALFILVKVIPTLSDTHLKAYFRNIEFSPV